MKNSSSTTVSDYDHLVPNRNIQITLYSIIGLVSLISNTLLFLVLGFTKKLHTKTNFLLASLAVCDWLIIVFGTTINISNLVATPIKDGICCTFTGVFILVPFLVSNFNLALIAFHRYILVVLNGYHKRLFTSSKLAIYVSSIWIFGIAVCLPPFFGWGKISYNSGRMHCMVDWAYSKSYLFFIQLCGFPIPLGIMVFSYYKVFTHSYASRKRLRASSDRHNLRLNTRDISLSICLLTVVVVFFSLYTPYAIIIYLEGLTDTKTSPAFSFAALFLAYTNSMCNFWIYAGMSKKFRRAFYDLLCTVSIHRKRNGKVLPLQVTSSGVTEPHVGDNIDRIAGLNQDHNITPEVSIRRRSVMAPENPSFYKSVDIGDSPKHDIINIRRFSDLSDLQDGLASSSTSCSGRGRRDISLLTPPHE
eukprot:TCONS_00020918-protein